LDGELVSGDDASGLTMLELALPGRFMLVRAARGRARDGADAELLQIAGAPSGDWDALPDFHPAGMTETAVACDWKLLVEQWLENLPRPHDVRRTFLAPNQLLEVSSTEASVLQVIPEAPGRCRIRKLDYSAIPRKGGARAAPQASTPKQTPLWLQQDIEVAESQQLAVAAGLDSLETAGAVSTQLAQFRSRISALLRVRS
jgi:hypothetical protein